MTARFRCVPQVTEPGAETFTRATFVLEDRVRGLQQTQAAPVRSLRSARTDEQKIADTIASKTHTS